MSTNDRTTELPDPGTDIILEGPITTIDLTPTFVDGDAELTIQSTDYGRILIRIPARHAQLCAATGLDLITSIAVDDRIRARGRVTDSGEVSICADSTHHLSLAAPASP